MASAPTDRLLRANHGRLVVASLRMATTPMQTAADGRPIRLGLRSAGQRRCGVARARKCLRRMHDGARYALIHVLSGESVQMSSFGNYEVVVAAHQGRHFAGHLHTRSLVLAGPQLTALDLPRAHESSAYPAAHRVYVDAD
jgi:hypothetical protein